MEQDRIRWNQKYREKDRSKPPSEIVMRYCSSAPKGKALDIGAGLGENALFLAENGFHVDAVDISDVAMGALDGKHPGVRAICRDLDDYEIPQCTYRLIVNVRFLSRRLFPQIIEGLVDGGLLIFETFIENPHAGEERMCRDYLLRENELLHAFLSLKVLYYEERTDRGHGGASKTASLVARKENRISPMRTT